jgi:hypothetical protein
MSVPEIDRSQLWRPKVWHPSETIKLVFVGYLAYRANLEAIQYLAEQVVPALDRAGIDSRISIIGNVGDARIPESVKRCPAIVLRGFVNDLAAEFSRHHAFMAPILSGTGIKSKVLEAMRLGIPVVGTPLAFSGINLPARQLLCWSCADEIPTLMARLTSPAQITAITTDARMFVQTEFSASVIDARWQAAIAATVRQADQSAA